MPRDRLLDAIREVYDSATNPAVWPGCLTSIGRLLSGTSTNLLYHDHRSHGGIQIAVGADPELYRLYREYGHAIDPWALALRPGAIPAGGVMVGASVVDHARMKKTEFYAAMGHRYDVTRSLVGVLESLPHQTAVLSVNRGDRGREFDSYDARVMSILAPHLRRALAIQRRLEGFDNQRAPILDAMDRLALGVVLVDNRGRPIFVNQYAARLLEERDGLSIEKDTLIAAVPAVATRLDRALASAIAVTSGTALATGNGELLIARSAGRRPLYASVTPVSQSHSYAGLTTRAAALIFLVDPDARPLPLHDRIRELFSLTPAEARVAGALAAGSSVTDISDEFGVSRETVRSQVKRVFDKAGVQSQSAFVRLVATESVRLVRLQSDE